jgi:aminomethyltransferase
MVPFAGYEMPVQYGPGILAEHLHTRAKAGLFDVSHMGQAMLTANAAELERIFPADIEAMRPGEQKYSFLLTNEGGIIDDLMLTRAEGHFFLVVNAANKQADFALIAAQTALTPLGERALLALQGPRAAAVLATINPDVRRLRFMQGGSFMLGSAECFITRSGYTGEDGFEISVPAENATDLARALLAHPDVLPIGLGARDSLRLEAGLCLHGSDIDTTTTPVEAGLLWAIGRRRREGGHFPGAEIIRSQIRNGAARKRVGILPEGKAPARAHTPILSGTGETLGEITSGGFAPSLGRPIAMGYVVRERAGIGENILLDVRGKNLPAVVVGMPFVKHNYYRGEEA